MGNNERNNDVTAFNNDLFDPGCWMNAQICSVRKGLSCGLCRGPGGYRLLQTAVEPPQVTIVEPNSQPLDILISLNGHD